MSISPEQFQQRLQATLEAVKTELPAIAQKLVSNAKALSERNILARGFGEVYSENRIPAFFLEGKELNAGGRAYLASHGVGGAPLRRRRGNAPIDNTATWKEFRAAQGRQVIWVDLSYSGRMWSGMIPLQPQIQGNIVKCSLGATNAEVAKEIAYNYASYGDFIRKGLGAEDFRLLEQVVVDDIGDITAQKLLL